MQTSRERKHNPIRLKAVRSELDGIKFDSKAERDFYLLLKRSLEGVEIIRPCNISLQGKSRSWRCDFGLCASTSAGAMKLSKLLCLMQGKDFDELSRPMVFLEFKGETDLTSGFIRPDRNFISRVNHLARYEPDILANTIFVGNASGGIVSYCTKSTFCVTPINTVDFFTTQVKSIWL